MKAPPTFEPCASDHQYRSLHGRNGGYAPLRHDMKTKERIGLVVILTILATAATILISGSGQNSSTPSSCDTVDTGYQCLPEISQFWGQYSPYFGAPSDIPASVPSRCEITFAQVLSRHGARDPTAGRSAAYNETIRQIHANVTDYRGDYAFLAKYEYTLGADQLSLFGEQQMINSGMQFYNRYQHLAEQSTPFVRTASQERVVVSAQKWAQGFHRAKVADDGNRHGDPGYPYDILIISEAEESNNSLSHSLCDNFETGPNRQIASSAKATWASIFVPLVQSKINAGLWGANVTIADSIVLMELCPFETVASPEGRISAFCSLFTKEDWHNYNYYQTIAKYYGYSHGNPLGPAQGIGFANELIARMTNHSVKDQTSTNQTLDHDPITFPLGKQLYADFSHDNDMTTIFAALGLYNGTKPFPNTTIVEAADAGGFSAAWTVPFAARAYFEKMRCDGHEEEFVRVLMNDRVLPLKQCGGDHLGRCSLTSFVKSLSYAVGNGNWDQCFV